MARGSTNNTGRRSTGRRGQDPVVNSGQRRTMGTSAYSLRPDSPSGSEFRAGMLSHKEGFGKSDAPDNRTSRRRNAGLARTSLGARYTISPSMKVPQDPNVLRNTRVVPPVTGSGRNFWAQERSYGAY